jgi:hypothetical protein
LATGRRGRRRAWLVAKQSRSIVFFKEEAIAPPF